MDILKEIALICFCILVLALYQNREEPNIDRYAPQIETEFTIYDNGRAY